MHNLNFNFSSLNWKEHVYFISNIFISNIENRGRTLREGAPWERGHLERGGTLREWAPWEGGHLERGAPWEGGHLERGGTLREGAHWERGHFTGSEHPILQDTVRDFSKAMPEFRTPRSPFSNEGFRELDQCIPIVSDRNMAISG